MRGAQLHAALVKRLCGACCRTFQLLCFDRIGLVVRVGCGWTGQRCTHHRRHGLRQLTRGVDGTRRGELALGAGQPARPCAAAAALRLLSARAHLSSLHRVLYQHGGGGRERLRRRDVIALRHALLLCLLVVLVASASPVSASSSSVPGPAVATACPASFLVVQPPLCTASALVSGRRYLFHAVLLLVLHGRVLSAFLHLFLITAH